MSARASATQDRPWIAGLIGRTASGGTSPGSQIDTRNYNGLVTTLRCLANARLSTGSKVHGARMSSPCRDGDISAVTRKAIARHLNLTGTRPAPFSPRPPTAARPSWPLAELGLRRPRPHPSWGYCQLLYPSLNPSMARVRISQGHIKAVRPPRWKRHPSDVASHEPRKSS